MRFAHSLVDGRFAHAIVFDMEDIQLPTVQYPSEQTIAAFGGTSAASRILRIPKSTIHRWKKSQNGLIPRWWNANLELWARENDIKLPKPKKVRQ